MYKHVHVYVHVNPTTLFIQLLLSAGILIVFYWFVDLHFREWDKGWGAEDGLLDVPGLLLPGPDPGE